MGLICLDTPILIWGVQGVAHEDQTDKIPAARAFIEAATKKASRLMVPSVVLGEFLTGFKDDNAADVIRTIQKGFFVPPYDAASAELAARLRKKAGGVEIKKIIAEDGVYRREIAADCQIIATARVHGATCIVTHDRRMLRSLARGVISVSGLPRVGVQLELGQSDT